jgi:hypothetical protein
MTEDRTVCGSKATRLAQLLSLGAEANQAADLRSDQQRKGDLLRDLLATKLPLDGSPAETSSCVGTGFTRSIASVLNESIEHHLLQENIAIKTLEQFKVHGAQLSRNASSPNKHEVANVLYYAAIAGALIYHNRRITEFSLDNLDTSFSKLSSLSWLTVSLRQLFEKAVETCHELISRKRDKDDE